MSYDEAARFLASAFPWPTPGAEPPEFLVNVHHHDKANPQYGFHGKGCRTVEEALNFIEYGVRKNADVYVCMSAQKTGKPKISKNGVPYYTAIRNATNVALHKSIYADVDVKPGQFNTTMEAARALGVFRRAAGLPAPSMLVQSGSGGFHVHWLLDEAIDTQRWQKLSQALVNAMRALNFGPIDYGCSTDTVRLLRVPNTFNHKHTPPRSVELGHAGTTYDVAYLEGILAKFPATAPAVNFAQRPATHLAQGFWPANMPPPPKDMAYRPLAVGIEKTKPKLEQIVKCCPTVENSYETGGAQDSQPLWWAMAKVAGFTEEGLEGFLDMSHQHPEYDEAAATQLYDRTAADQKTKDFGWPRCSAIQDAGGAQCAGCPHLHKGKSPFNFIEGAEPEAPASPTPDVSNLLGYSRVIDDLTGIPLNGYVIDDDGIIHQVRFKKGTEGEQEMLPICPYKVDKIWRQFDPYQMNLLMTFDHRGPLPIHIAARDAASLDKLKNTLYDQGAWLDFKFIPRFHSFMSSWIEQMRGRNIEGVASERYGWSFKNNKADAFVYGKAKYNGAGETPVVSPDQMLLQVYQPTGSLDPWLRASKLVCDQNRPSLNAILASAFAGPLVMFSGENGFMVSAYSPESGMQKSTAMRTAQAVWGDPIRGMNSLSDTANSVNDKLGKLRHLTLFYDEIKMEEGNRRHLDTLFELSQGKQKARMSREIQQREVHTWATMMQTASNHSMVAFIGSQSKSTTAGVHRVFEYRVERAAGRPGFISPGEAGKILTELNSNYGHAGAVYAKYLGANAKSIADEVESTKDKIFRAVNGETEERFWITAMTILGLGAKYANKLNLTDIDTEQLMKFFSISIDRLRRAKDGARVDLGNPITVLERMAQYINQRKKFTMVTDYVPQGVGRPMVCTVINTQEVMHASQITVRIARDSEIIRISKNDLQDWLLKAGIAPTLVIDPLLNMFGGKELRGSVTSGVKAYTNATETIIELVNRKNNLSQLYDFTK